MGEEFAEIVYELLIGEGIPDADDPIVENMFAEGRTCDRFYGEVYDANRHLCERLGVEEDKDVETIIKALLDISRLLGEKMFLYGMRYQSGLLKKK